MSRGKAGLRRQEEVESPPEEGGEGRGEYTQTLVEPEDPAQGRRVSFAKLFRENTKKKRNELESWEGRDSGFYDIKKSRVFWCMTL